MDWEEALETVVSRTKCEGYRAVCADGHPHRDQWRARMIEKATGMPPVPAYPPIAIQAGNVAGSLWEWAVSGFSMTSESERERRLAICRACVNFDAGRCRICGCHLAAKVAMRSSRCPLEPPKW